MAMNIRDSGVFFMMGITEFEQNPENKLRVSIKNQVEKRKWQKKRNIEKGN
ncbi:hypothetical protein CCACVL1_14930 [Corchorus capsularis]|uniref:Uncharacterized protein n=1 Tax=Corchorus capsularis TaxID=210143 RepID=A0A1R3I4Y1_COCAP|nr:hypothetical protein CCACVL1_14930 [Corchorus capsularis]